MVQRTKEHQEKLNLAHLGQKRSLESRERMRMAHLGKTLTQEHKNKIGNAHRGMKRSQETRERMSIAQYKLWENPEFRERARISQKELHKNPDYIRKIKEGQLKAQTPETRKKKSDANKGEKCYFWKGGLTRLNKLIRESFKMRDWRNKVFKEDNYLCAWCGNKKEIEAHHWIPFSKLINYYNIKTLIEAENCEALWNTENGITFCKSCHSLFGKRN